MKKLINNLIPETKNNFFTEEDAKMTMSLVNSNELEKAREHLFRVEESARNSFWHFVYAKYNYKKGWLESAYIHYKNAYELSPNNREFSEEYQRICQQRQGNEKKFLRSENKGQRAGNCLDLCLDFCPCCN